VTRTFAGAPQHYPDGREVSLSAADAGYLALSAISSEVALTGGVYSIGTESELPKWAADAGVPVPGMMFTHNPPSIYGDNPDAAPIWQYRPRESGGGPKYVQQPGTGSAISLHPEMSARVQTAKTALIVEGTKQYLAAVSTILESKKFDDVIAVGIQGCFGWSVQQSLNPELTEVLSGRSKIIVAFDADLSSNLDVWRAGRQFRENLKTFDTPVAFLMDKDASGTDGLDDLLAKHLVADRVSKLADLLKTASVKLPKRPSTEEPTQDTLIIDWDRGRFLRNSDDGPIPVTNWAARVTKLRLVRDDLHLDTVQTVNCDVEFVRGFGDERETHILSIEDAELEDVLGWLRKIPGGRGVNGVFTSPDWKTKAEIASTIRATSDAKTETFFPRTGLATVDGRLCHLHTRGGLTADGNVDSTGGILSGPVASVEYFGDEELSDELVAAGFAAFDRLSNAFENQGVLTALLAAMMLAATGAPPHCALMVWGGKGTGKSTIGQVFGSFYGRAYASKVMLSANATRGVLMSGYSGAHQTCLFVDDARNKATDRDNEQLAAGMDHLVRVSYDGPSVAVSRLIRGADGKYRTNSGINDYPLAIIIGENLDSIRQGSSSTPERMLTIRVTETTWLPEGLRDAEDDAEEGLLNVVWSKVVTQLLKKAEALALTDGKDISEAEGALKKYANTRRLKYIERLQNNPETKHWQPRPREVTASLFTGWKLWCQLYAAARGVKASKDELHAGFDILSKMMEDHLAQTSGEVPDDVEVALERLAAAINNGRTTIEDNPGDGTDRIGARKTVAGPDGENVDVIAFKVASIESLLRLPAAQARGIFRDVAVKDGCGNVTRTVRIGGQVLRCICIPVERVGLGEADEN